MGVALGWMALALAVVGAPDSGRGGVPIKYTVRFIEVEGLSWRDAAYSRLTPVTRQGAATVWTAPTDVATRMVANPVAQVLQAPSVIAWSGATAHITSRANRQLVTQVSWNGDGHSIESRPETVRTGSTATMAGRKIDQGVLVRMVLQDTQILAVHRVAVGDSRAAPSDPATKKAGYAPAACADAPGCCATAPAASCCETKAAAKVTVEVPEMGSQEVAGEWLIPNEGVLLVSFGPHTVAGKDGKAVIRERLAIVEADEAAAPLGTPTPHPAPWGTPASSVPALPAPAGTAAASAPVAAAPSPRAVPAAPVAAIPPMPSRSIPQGYHADGKAADLPPLPSDEADDADEGDPAESAETHASPQSKKPRQPGVDKTAGPGPRTDAAAKKVQFTISNFQAIPSLFQPAPTVGLQFLLPIRPISVRLPFNRRLEVEIYGRVVRAPEPARSIPDLANRPAKDGAATK